MGRNTTDEHETQVSFPDYLVLVHKMLAARRKGGREHQSKERRKDEREDERMRG